MTVRVEVLPSGDLKYPWKVRVTTRDEHGRLVGARHLRAFTEGEAEKIAASLERERPAQGAGRSGSPKGTTPVPASQPTTEGNTA